jgi:hypothetical protein
MSPINEHDVADDEGLACNRPVPIEQCRFIAKHFDRLVDYVLKPVILPHAAPLPTRYTSTYIVQHMQLVALSH